MRWLPEVREFKVWDCILQVDEKSLDNFNFIKSQASNARPKKTGKSQKSSSYDALNRDVLHREAGQFFTNN